MGVGILNFTFALPAFKTIDTFGRRSLLLVTFPFLAIFQLLNAIAFRPSTWNSGAQTTKSSAPLVIAGLYLFAIAYSPGEGPVPFVCIYCLSHDRKKHSGPDEYAALLGREYASVYPRSWYGLPLLPANSHIALCILTASHF